MENLIDELEDAPGGSASLRYPPDCSECIVQLPGYVGVVRVTPRELEVVSPAGSSPAELVKTFVEGQRGAGGQSDAGTAHSRAASRRGFPSNKQAAGRPVKGNLPS